MDSQFLGNTKKHIFNTYAFTNAIGLRRGYTIAFPSIFNLFMRMHKCVVLFFLWKRISNIYMFHRHVIVGGNAFLIHSRLQKRGDLQHLSVGHLVLEEGNCRPEDTTANKNISIMFSNLRLVP